MASTTILPGLTFSDGSGKGRLPLPTPGQILLISDDLSSPGDFLVHSSLALLLKQSSDARAAVVSSRDAPHWKAISLRLGVNLAQPITNGKLLFIDPARILLEQEEVASQTPSQPLIKVYQEIREHIRSTSGTEPDSTARMIILEDLAALSWVGISDVDISRFIRALKALSRSAKSSLIILQHSTSPNRTSPITRELKQTALAHIEVSSLSSGRSGAISGEVCIHPGPILNDAHFVSRPRSSALQYRLEAAGVEFFDRGTGAGVL